MKHDRHGSERRAAVDSVLEEARRDFLGGKSARAESLLEALLAEHPSETEALLALAVIADGTGRRDAAMQRLVRALEVDPNYSPALSSMSALLLHEGRAEEAVEFAKRAVATDPGSSECHAALARCLVKANRRPESVGEFQRAVSLSPGNPGPMVELSDVLIALRREREALELLKAAVPRSADVRPLVNLAYLELRFGRIEDAERYVRAALTRKPDLAPAEALLARILTEKLDPDAAESHWQRAEKLSNAAGSILVEKALALSAVGRFEDAIRNLRRSIDLEPRQGAAYQVLAYAKKIDQSDLPLVELMEEVAADPDLADPERLAISFALGKAYDNLGDYGRAFECFDRAHALRKKISGSFRFDRDGFRAYIDAKIDRFSKELFAEPGRVRNPSSLPILVVGMMRSGTTLVEQILSCHPEVGGAGEQDFWGDKDVFDQRQSSSAAEAYVDLLKSIAPGFPRVVDKNPANLQVLGAVHMALPNAHLIHTRRNLVDTAISIWTTPMNTTAEFVDDRGDIVWATKQLMRLTDHWREVLSPDRFLEVRYEELARQPALEVPRLLEFCGLEWNDACLHPEANDRRIRTPSLWQVRQPIYTSSTARRKHYEPWLGKFEELLSLE